MKCIDKALTFENFQTYDGSQWAVASLKLICDYKNHFNPIYIFGEEGVGKSHLLHATANKIIQNGQGYVASYAAEELTVEEISKLAERKLDYILIDDMQLLPKNPNLEEALCSLIEDGDKQLVFTGSQSTTNLEVNADLQKWLQWGLTTEIRKVDDCV